MQGHHAGAAIRLDRLVMRSFRRDVEYPDPMMLPNVAGQHLRQLAKITPACPKERRRKDHFQFVTGPRIDRPLFLIDGKMHPLAGVLLDILAIE